MKRMISAIFGLFMTAFAVAGPLDPNDIRITQNNSNNPSNGIITRYLSFSCGDSVIWLNAATQLPECLKIGSNLSISSGVLSASGGSQADWSASSGPSQILNKPTFATVAFTGDYSNLSNQPALGTAAPLNVPSSGDATTGQVVIGSDTRLSDARAPTAHTHTASQISDSTSVGRNVMTAASMSAARTAIGAGTSSFSGAYGDLTGAPTTYAWSAITGTPTTRAGYGITDAYPLSGNPSGFLTSISGAQVTSALGLTPVDQAGARGAISLTTTGTGAATYNSSTGVLNVPTPATAAARSFSNPTRPLNTAFQISSTRDAHVTYSVDISVTSALLAGQSGRVILEYADDSGITTNVVTVSSSPSATGGVLNIVNLGSGLVTGWVPAAKYARIRTANITGTPTYSFQQSQEVLQ